MGFSSSGSSGSIAASTDVALSNPVTGQVLSYDSSIGKWKNTAGASATLDATSADIQPLGITAAGTTGKAADAGHVHAMPRLDQVSAPTSAVVLNAQKITGLANGSSTTDAAAFGQIPTAGTGLTNTSGVLSVNYGTTGTMAAAGNDSRITGAAQKTSNLSDLASASNARTNLGLATIAATGAYTDLSGKPTIPNSLAIGTSTTTAGALTINQLTPVDATAGTVAMTLPTGQATGTLIGVRKQDATANTVTITGNIASVASTTHTLQLSAETVEYQTDSSGSWWVVGGNKTLTSLMGIFSPQLAPTKTISTPTYTIAISDLGYLIEFTATCTVTAPVGLPAGFNCELKQAGSGAITVSSDGTSVLQSYTGTYVSAGLGASVTIFSRSSANSYWIDGALVQPSTAIPDSQPSVSSTTSGSPSTSVPNWTHTVGSGTNRGILVAVITSAGSGGNVTNETASIDGASLTRLTYADYASTPQRRVALFYGFAPSAGSHTMSATASTSTNIIAVAVSFSNIAQTAANAFGTPVTTAASQMNDSIAVPSTTIADTIFAAHSIRLTSPPAVAALSGETVQQYATISNLQALVTTQSGVTGTSTAGFSGMTTSDSVAGIAVAVKGF